VFSYPKWKDVVEEKSSGKIWYSDADVQRIIKKVEKAEKKDKRFKIIKVKGKAYSEDALEQIIEKNIELKTEINSMIWENVGLKIKSFEECRKKGNSVEDESFEAFYKSGCGMCGCLEQNDKAMLLKISNRFGIKLRELTYIYNIIKEKKFIDTVDINQLENNGVPVVFNLSDALSLVEKKCVSIQKVYTRIKRHQISFSLVRDILFDMAEQGNKIGTLLSIEDTKKMLRIIAKYLGIKVGVIQSLYFDVKHDGILTSQNLRRFAELGIPLASLLIGKLSSLKKKPISAKNMFIQVINQKINFNMVQDILLSSTKKGGYFFNRFKTKNQ
jgi:hypothetical protein